jgi:methyl-accepting chemotaxis protein
MPRVHFVKKARKEHHCHHGHTIQKGESYYWAKPAWRARIVHCQACGYLKPSELTSSGHLATLYTIQESLAELEVTEKNLEGTQASLNSFAEEAEQVAEEYEESADNMEEYFEGSSQAEEIRMKGENCMEWADYLREAADNMEDMIEGVQELVTERDQIKAEDEDSEDKIATLNEELEEILEQARGLIDDASGGLEL